MPLPSRVSPPPDKSRMIIMLAVVLWVSALAAIIVGMRFKMKPILLVGLLDGMLALFVTLLAGAGRRFFR